MPQGHALAVAPVLLWQVLVVVVGERSGAFELRPDASGVGLVSRPSLGVNVRPVINWVPDIGVGTDRPEMPVRFGRDIVVEELINRHTISILPNWRPEHPSVTRGRGKESKDEQSPEHILPPAKQSSKIQFLSNNIQYQHLTNCNKQVLLDHGTYVLLQDIFLFGDVSEKTLFF